VPAVYGKKESGLVVFGEPTGSPFRCGFESLFFSGRLFRSAMSAGLTLGSSLSTAARFGFLSGAGLAGFAFGFGLRTAVGLCLLGSAALACFAFGLRLGAAARWRSTGLAVLAFGFGLSTTAGFGRIGATGCGTGGHGKGSQTDQDTTHEIAPKR